MAFVEIPREDIGDLLPVIDMRSVNWKFGFGC
jgi:hypothetical protein